MKTFCIILLTLVIQSNSFSQLSNSLFSSYKNKDLKIRALTVSGALSGYNANSDFNLNGRGLIQYSQFTNFDKIQSEQFYNFDITSQSRNTKSSPGFDPINNHFNLTSYVHNKSRYYPKSEFFYGFGYRIFNILLNDNLKEFDLSGEIIKEKTNIFNIEVPISIGIGRRYPVQSVHQAMWIYSDLEKNQLLLRKVTDKDIEELAHIIDDNYYTRFFDERYKRIQDLGRIDSVLNTQAILTAQNISYFTSINDMYLYYSGSNRYRGKIFEAGIAAEYYNYLNKYTDSVSNSKTVYHAITPNLFVAFSSYKPINLHWQFDYELKVEYGFRTLLNEDLKQYGSNDNPYSLNGLISLHYNPDTRSDLQFNISTRYGNKIGGSYTIGDFDFNNFNHFFRSYLISTFNNSTIKFLDSNHNGFNYTTESPLYTIQFSFHHYYYINPRFRTNTHLTLSYFSDDNPYFTTLSNHILNFGITLNYTVF